jgi:hypothetical protein
MGVFDDKKFDELDWLSQATEPIESKLNEILSLLPEEIVVDYNLISRSMSGTYWGNFISVRRLISACSALYSTFGYTSYKEEEMLSTCFTLEMEQGCIINFEKGTLTGNILIKKIKHTFEDKDLLTIFGVQGLEQVRNMSIISPEQIARANEIMDLLGKCEDGLRSKSPRTKRTHITARMRGIMSENEWKIKNVELANKVGLWIENYVSDGNLAAFSNFCRLKVMTHKGIAIYSMEEIP